MENALVFQNLRESIQNRVSRKARALCFMENAPILPNLRNKTKLGPAEGIFSLFPIWQPILDWLKHAQKWSDLRDLKAYKSQIVQIFI